MRAAKVEKETVAYRKAHQLLIEEADKGLARLNAEKEDYVPHAFNRRCDEVKAKYKKKWDELKLKYPNAEY